MLRIRVDFERTGTARWLADPPKRAGWQYVDDPAEAGVWSNAEGARLWRAHRGDRAWRREFAHTEEVE